MYLLMVEEVVGKIQKVGGGVGGDGNSTFFPM